MHGLSGPMVWYEGAGTSSHRWLIPDERGSIIARDNAGSVSINTYDEYGQGGGANGGRFQYVGLPWIAEAGVYQMGARAYSPSIGRWMQTDPILTAGGVNLYAYVGNDPVNSIDASGLSESGDCVRPTGTFICGVMPIGGFGCSGNCSIYQPTGGQGGGNAGGGGAGGDGGGAGADGGSGDGGGGLRTEVTHFLLLSMDSDRAGHDQFDSQRAQSIHRQRRRQSEL